MAQQRIGKTAHERAVLAAMEALARGYTGSVTLCQPSVARGHEVKVSYEPLCSPGGAPRQGIGCVLTMASGNVRFRG